LISATSRMPPKTPVTHCTPVLIRGRTSARAYDSVVGLPVVGGRIEFRILGQLEVARDGKVIALGGAKQQAVIALLALHSPNPISRDRLIEELWGERPPPSALHAVQVHISGIRAALRKGGGSDQVVRTSSAGYVLDVGEDQIDARCFERLVRRGQDAAAKDPERARHDLEEALALWRGSPLEGSLRGVDATLEADRLDELHTAAAECLFDIRLDRGEDAELVDVLKAMVARHPLRERLCRQLMLALYRSGRQSEALAAYRGVRASLDELGLLPSRELRDLEQAILRHDESLNRRNAVDVGVVRTGLAFPSGPSVMPQARRRESAGPPRADSQQPVDELPMIGRAEPMAQLLALLDRTEVPVQQPLLVVSGEPGIGKSRLVREFAARATAAGCLAPLTSAEDDEVVPYRPFSELVRAVLATERGGDYLNQLGSLATELTLLVPELATSPVPWSSDPGLTRTRLFEGVTRLLEIAARNQPVVILIDDAHRMGRATGALVRALLGKSDSQQRVVVATRDGYAHVSSGLHEVLRQFDAASIPLGGLTEADLEGWLELVNRGGGNEREWMGTGADLYAQTGGVPLLVQAALREDGRLAQRAPKRVRIDHLVAERRAALTQQANDILDLAAIAGLGVEPDVIAAVTGEDFQSVEGTLRDIARSRGLLAGGPGPSGYTWYHALVRESVLSSVPVGTQRRWREQLSGVLATRGLALRAAKHALDSLGEDAGGALMIVLQGVDEAIAALAFETGEDLCRRALEVAGPGLDAEIAVEFLTRLGRCLALSGQREAAEQAWAGAAERARRAHRADLLARTALATEPLARVVVDTPLRWTLLQEAMAVSHLEPRLQIQLTCAWLDEAAMPQHATTDPQLADRAVRAARQQKDPMLLLRSLKAAHTVARATQRVNRALSDELCTVADGLGDAEWEGIAHHLAFLDAVISLDRESAEQHLLAFVRAAEAATSPRLRWSAGLASATWEMLQGDLDASHQRAYDAAQLGQSYGIADAGLAVSVHAFFTAFHMGTLAAAAEVLSRYASDHPELWAFTAGAGLALVAAGDLEAAGAIRDRLFPTIAKPGVDESWPVAACLAAQLCFDTHAPASQCEPLRTALQAYPGRAAVLGSGVAECGPVQRYVGLLTAGVDAATAIDFLRSAHSEAQRFGAFIWTQRTERDIAAVTEMATAVASTTPRRERHREGSV
jgi:DNA-binding SARP family transcriptional activator